MASTWHTCGDSYPVAYTASERSLDTQHASKQTLPSQGPLGRAGQGAVGPAGAGMGALGVGGRAGDLLPASGHMLGATTDMAHAMPSDVTGLGLPGEVRRFPRFCWPVTHVRLSHASRASQLLQIMDREARVLRYKEKRKNRKFNKTIRCAKPHPWLCLCICV